MYRSQTVPIIDALKKYISDGVIRFHMPGHKGGGVKNHYVTDLLGSKVFEADVTNVPGMDDLHQCHGVIRKAQELAAQTFGADYSYFLVNGSSCGLQALVMTVCNPGDEILVPRNMHRSILSGIILSGAVPVFFKPEYDYDFGIPLGTTAETITRCLDSHPDIKGVLIVNPTYHGITSDIPSIARAVHARNIPLLVDEAHGPHLFFHEDLPETSLAGGADATVQGAHKILSAFTQASMLHLKGELINRQRLEATLRLLQSTSTSYLLLASLDGARAQIASQGRQLIQKALELAGFLRREIKKINGFATFADEMIGRPGVAGIDLTKVTISVKEQPINGLWAEKYLREKHNIQVEMSDVFNLLLIVGFGNTKKDAVSFLNALKDMKQYLDLNSEDIGRYQVNKDLGVMPGIPDLVITPREAFWAPVVTLPLGDAVGRISTEVIACYPPGIPVICPGERITEEVVEYLGAMRDMGVHFQGCYDASLHTVRVVK